MEPGTPSQMKSITGWAAAAAVVALLLSSAPAAAAPPENLPARAPLEACIAAATAKKLESWSCLGGQLTYLAPRADAEHPARYVTERVADDPQTVEAAANIGTMAVGDDYDTWCEFGTTCTRRISAYISETKGNAAYGDQNGVIGTFDVIIRNSLNGRQARWTVSWIHETGPRISISGANVHCTQVGAFFSSCGTHAADNGDASIAIGLGRFNGPLIYGNRLVQSAQYTGEVRGWVVPSGHAYPNEPAAHGSEIQLLR